MSWIPPWSSAFTEPAPYIRKEAKRDSPSGKPQVQQNPLFLDDTFALPSVHEDASPPLTPPQEKKQKTHGPSEKDADAHATALATPASPPSSQHANTTSTFSAPSYLWKQTPTKQIQDSFGIGRIPAFWYTLNLPYNYLFEIQRFYKATAECAGFTLDDDEPDHLHPSSREAHAARCTWTLNNPDIVTFIHALRIEIIVKYVMAHIVDEDDAFPF